MTTESYLPLQSYLDLAVSLSHQAGSLILSAFNSSKSITIKSNPLDIVTETDKQAEQLIIAAIRQRFPSHAFIAEESFTGPPGVYDITDTPTWIIDPVDGTNNFVHSLPSVCVSIALMIGKEVVIGVVHAPVLGETFTSIKGQGSYLTNHAIYSSTPSSPPPSLPSSSSHRLSVSTITSLSSAAVITELGYDRAPLNIQRQLQRLRLLTTVHSLQSLRSYGSCALNLCYVACGRAEAFYEGMDAVIGPKPWDSAAAALIVREAGGVMSDTTGAAFNMCSGRVLGANNQTIAQLIIDVCREVEQSLALPAS